MEAKNEEILNPKSPKSPKLSEKVSEMDLGENKEECIIEEMDDDKTSKSNNVIDSDNFEKDPVIIGILNQLISSAPAGEVKKVSALCAELFPNYAEIISEEERIKMEREGYIFEGKLITEDKQNEDQAGIEDEFEIEFRVKLDKYVKDLFPGSGAFSINKTNENEWKIDIVGERLRPKAFWSGHWHSKWKIQFINSESDIEAKEFKIEGQIDLVVHYHEEGSVQLSATKEIPSRVNFKSETLSQAIEKIYYKIKDSEDSVQLGLNEAYQQLAENMFKKLRRQLPVTRTKMDWGKFVNYNLSSELKK